MPYERQRQVLEQLLATLSRRFEVIQQDLRRSSGPVPQDFADQAVEVANDEVLAQLARDGPTSIARIQAALDRLEAGSYGRCAACGCEIPPARLDALPYALTCVSCAQARESGSESGP